MTVKQAYTQTSAGALTIKVGSDPGGGQFGQLVTTGLATLAGTFDVTLANGFGPTTGQSYQVATLNGGSTGSFTTVNVPVIGGTPLYSVTVNASNILLNAIATAPDLQAGTVTLPTPPSEVGQTATISYTVTNNSNVAVPGSWTDALYLSPDGLLADATLIGEATHTGGVAANGGYSGMLVHALPVVTPGPSQEILVVDDQLLVPDINRANNTAASGPTFQVNAATALRVLSTTPVAGTIGQAFSNVTLQFSKAVLASSFTPQQVDVFMGPAGPVFVNNVVQIDATHFTIQFPTVTTVGDYHFTVGPNITDLFGVAMDQDNSGTAGQASDAITFDLNLMQATPDLTPDAVTISASAQTGGTFPANGGAYQQGQRHRRRSPGPTPCSCRLRRTAR